MKNNKGQSLIEVIFSMGVVILVLVGVVMLMVITAKAKRIASERQKAIELSQLMIEETVLYSKNNTLEFWETISVGNEITTSVCNNFSNYSCQIQYISSDCDNKQCKLIFNITWEDDSQNLSVERLFSREGL